MTKLSTIELFWYFGKLTKSNELIPHIEKALIRWYQRRDTKDYEPVDILFNKDQLTIFEKEREKILDLDLRIYLSRIIQKDHFSIRGYTDEEPDWQPIHSPEEEVP